MYFPFFIVKRPNSAKRIQRILHRYAALFDLDSGVPLLEVAVLLAIYQVTSRCWIQSVVIDSSAKKTTLCNRQLFPSCLKQQSEQ
ncbi:hypothetical protein BTN99_01470 [Vibrio campbellii]|nr:hypothetical protein BTN99_01470 [Vibrio campbellii]